MGPGESIYWKKTYTIEQGPLPLSTEEYARSVNEEYRRLLSDDCEEKVLQQFLEKNPSLVPGARTPGAISGHYPLHCALITQPVLRGIGTKIPDFMWISTHSSHWYPTLVEIEKPSKKLFRKDGVPTSEFTQAKNQLDQWRAWFSDPSNVSVFMDMYGIPNYMRSQRQMKLHMILIYGQRSEYESDAGKSKARASLLPASDMELMSYDRLSCDKELCNAITVRLSASHRYEAIAVPPTIRLGPELAERYNVIDGVADAVKAASAISSERKEFLIKRLAYWKSWGQQDEKGMVSSGDVE